ncbi:MAG: hypothetical protein K9L59_19460 [Desulfobacterales bacterium]|nr:hypothetical protein [Desulfobacterales bacterium]
MKSHKNRQTVRRSVALPEKLAEESLSVAPPGAEKNFNRVVILALTEFVENRRKEAFAKAMKTMAADSSVMAESAAINSSFRQAEADGLPND